MRPKFIQIEYNWHQLFKHQSLYRIASLLPHYVAHQMLPSALLPVDMRRAESNIFEFSNFVFVREDVALPG